MRAGAPPPAIKILTVLNGVDGVGGQIGEEGDESTRKHYKKSTLPQAIYMIFSCSRTPTIGGPQK